jgi:hypothetical protein
MQIKFLIPHPGMYAGIIALSIVRDLTGLDHPNCRIRGLSGIVIGALEDNTGRTSNGCVLAGEGKEPSLAID